MIVFIIFLFYKRFILLFTTMCVCGGHRSWLSWSCSYRTFWAVPGGCRKLEMQSPGKGSLDPFLIVEPSLQIHLSSTQRSISFYLYVGPCVCVRVHIHVSTDAQRAKKRTLTSGSIVTDSYEILTWYLCLCAEVVWALHWRAIPLASTSIFWRKIFSV